MQVLSKYVDHGKPVSVTTTEIQNRVLGRLINEAAMCLQDEIIASPVDGDMGMVFGIGFFPGHGGPFRYIDTLGVQVGTRSRRDRSLPRPVGACVGRSRAVRFSSRRRMNG